MRLGLIVKPKGNPAFSNMEGGGGWGWIGTAISGIVDSGFKYGANKENNATALELQRKQNMQAAYGSISKSDTTAILAALLARDNTQPKTTESNWSKNLLPIALIASAAALVIFFVLKSESK